jgi:hypothetical protein
MPGDKRCRHRRARCCARYRCAHCCTRHRHAHHYALVICYSSRSLRRLVSSV